MKRLAIFALVAWTLSAIAADVDYRALGTNAFYTNGLIVNSKHWTNDVGAYMHQPGRSVDPTGASPGPPYFIRTDGSFYIGTNVTQDTSPAPGNGNIYFPYIVSMSSSNEPIRVRGLWQAIDSEDYNFYSIGSLSLQNDGTAPFGAFELHAKSSFGLLSEVFLHTDPTSATTYAVRVKRNGNTTFTTQQNGETHINAIDNGWLFKGQTNGANTIQMRADGSTFIGSHPEIDLNLSDFSRIYSPGIVSAVLSNEAPTLRSHLEVVDSELFNFYSYSQIEVVGDKDSPSSKLIMENASTNGNSGNLTISVIPLANSSAAISLTHSTDRFVLDQLGDLSKIKSLAYSWPTARGSAGAVLRDRAADGTLTWDVLGFGVGPGTNNFISKFNSTGTNVINSPLYSEWTNSVWQLSRADGVGYTNSATNAILSIQYPTLATNSRLEFVAGNPFGNQVSHIRHITDGFSGRRPPIIINDSWYFHPATDQISGNPQGDLLPTVDSTTGSTGFSVGSTSLRVKSFAAGVGGFKASPSTPGVDANFGAIGGQTIGVATDRINIYNSSFQGILEVGVANEGINCVDMSFCGNKFHAEGNGPNIFLRGSPTEATGVWQWGTNNTGSGTAQAYTITGIAGVGTDKTGGDHIIAGGPGSGTGAGGAVRAQTSRAIATGTTAQTLQDRLYICPNPKTLTESSATLVFNVALASGKSCGLIVKATTFASDGTDHQSVIEEFAVAAVNKAGTVTTTVSGSTPAATLTSSGTLTTAWTAVANGNTIDIKNNAVSSLTQTNLNVQWRVELDGDGTLVVTP